MEGTLDEKEVEYEIWLMHQMVRSITVERRMVRVACNQTWFEDPSVREGWPIADRTSHIATSQQADQPCCQPFIAQYTATSGAIHTHQAKDSIVGT